MSISSSHILINRQVASFLHATDVRLKTLESKMALLNQQKEEKQNRLKRADDEIKNLEDGLENFKRASNDFLNQPGRIPGGYIPHRDGEIKIFGSKISQANKVKEQIIQEIKAHNLEIAKVQTEINTQAKKEKKFEYFQELQHN